MTLIFFKILSTKFFKGLDFLFSYFLILPLIKILLGSKRQAHTFLDIYILVILVSKQFATFLHIFGGEVQRACLQKCPTHSQGDAYLLFQ